MEVFLIIGIPVFLALSAYLIKDRNLYGIVNAISYFIILCLSVVVFRKVISSGEISLFGDSIYLDALSAFFIFVTASVAFASALYSIGYIKKDIEKGILPEHKAKLYYFLFNLFCCSMFLVVTVNNLGLLWVAVEMTTLVSAFLVGLYNSKGSVEAAWKYIIICSVGIIFALLGTILFYYAFSLSGAAKSLHWSDILSGAAGMDKNILKLAFIFILVGYGTKAGLAPMHTWLPDAHSQAPAPISALLSGVLIKTAIYAILRFGIIVVKVAGLTYFSHLMLLLGLISLGLSCAFILVQKDLKRLLAYSSIEHIGIISVAFGLGSPLAVAAGLLHIFNHAVTKSLMFFSAGNIISAYGKHNMNAIRGVLKVLPFTGFVVLIGCFALTGFPPFCIFISEMMILFSAFTSGSYIIGILVLFFLVVIFGAFIYRFGEMVFGNMPKGMKIVGEPLSGKLALIFLLAQICLLGIIFLFINKDLLCIIQRFLQQ